jgi:hypothetical protein
VDEASAGACWAGHCLSEKRFEEDTVNNMFGRVMVSRLRIKSPPNVRLSDRNGSPLESQSSGHLLAGLPDDDLLLPVLLQFAFNLWLQLTQWQLFVINHTSEHSFVFVISASIPDYAPTVSADFRFLLIFNAILLFRLAFDERVFCRRTLHIQTVSSVTLHA